MRLRLLLISTHLLLPLLLSRDVNNYIQTETIYFIKEGASTLTKLWAH